jgi:predicted RNA-binding protein with PUA domain
MSVTAVLAIPREDLPYTVINAGKVKHHRRYDPRDIVAYETRRRGA